MSKWKETTASLLYSEKKMTMPEAKALCEEGDKLKLSGHELKVLRTAIRSTRGWLSKVRKCKVEHGGTAAIDLERLIHEHEVLLVSMPEEVDKLKQATKGFCLCRRPYEGFMIGCDGCDEWYHGPCIGVSESQADRYDKYVCVRCCVKRIFENSSSNVAFAIKKWTSTKDRKKARQAEYQKHQRRVRKEKKDLEKLEMKISVLRPLLESMPKESDNSNCLVQSKQHPERQDCGFVEPRPSQMISNDGETQGPPTKTSVDDSNDFVVATAELDSETKRSAEPADIPVQSNESSESETKPIAETSAEMPGQTNECSEEKGGEPAPANSSIDVVGANEAVKKKLDALGETAEKEKGSPTQSKEGKSLASFGRMLLRVKETEI